MRKFLMLLPLPLLLAACDGNTTGADNVTANSARLTYQGHCDPNDAGRVFVEYQAGNLNPNTDPWQNQYGGDVLPDNTVDADPNTPGHQNDADSLPDACGSRIPASGEAPGSVTVTGLASATSYRYRVGFEYNNGGRIYTDSDGGINSGNAYHTFATCKAVAAGTGFSSAVSNPGPSNCIALAAGTYDWGDYIPPANMTIKAAPGVTATVVGEARVGQPGVTLENLYLRPSPGEDHATLYVTASDFTGRRLDVSANNLDFVMPVLTSGSPNNVRILDTNVHDAFGSGCFAPGTGSRTHAIYWSAGTNGLIQRVWLHHYTGYGLHFYGPGSVAGTHVEQVVSDSRSDCDPLNQLGNVKDTGGTADGITVNKSITQGGNWRCDDGEATVSNSRMSGSMPGCTDGGGNATGVNTSFNSTTDLRVPGNPDFQFVPGPQ
jgi:hypothetical protein